jgi:very-short-patch-repair endonuclease
VIDRNVPSPGAARHPLPQGEREVEAQSRPDRPSPLEGEGASRSEAGEGQFNKRHKEWRTELTPTLRKRARSMRTNATEAEALLWKIVRNRRFVDFKFRRQVPIGRYIVDFMCPTAMLIVELDGSQHAESTRDEVRDAWLAAAGYRILRVWNNELTHNRDGVLEAIWHRLHPSPHPAAARPPSPSRGEGSDVARSRAPLPTPLAGEGASRSVAGEGKFSQGEPQ